MNMEQYRQELMDTAKRLFAVDSPSGFTADVVTLAKELAEAQGYAARRINKGNLAITVPGRDHSRTVGVCAHIDTLGLMCRAITEKGELLFTRIGGPLLHTLDGEYCRIHTRDGRVYTGTILSLSPSVHVYDDADSRSRDEQNMYVRVDEPVRSRDDVTALGIAVGDYICIDTKTTVTDSGYLKSRFIDDKGSAACLLTALKIMRDNGIVPQYDTEFYLTVYEEVGHGGADIPASLSELLAVDMGCIGGDLTCTEKDPVEGRLVVKDRIADAMFQEALLRPEQYQILATPNLNGDYISDALAAQVGGIGIAPGGNINYTTGHAIFEATHGTAPKYANLDKVNPGSVILSGEMMFRYLGWNEAADLIITGLENSIKAKTVTYDLARLIEGAKEVKCSEFGSAIIANM